MAIPLRRAGSSPAAVRLGSRPPPCLHPSLTCPPPPEAHTTAGRPGGDDERAQGDDEGEQVGAQVGRVGQHGDAV